MSSSTEKLSEGQKVRIYDDGGEASDAIIVEDTGDRADEHGLWETPGGGEKTVDEYNAACDADERVFVVHFVSDIDRAIGDLAWKPVDVVDMWQAGRSKNLRITGYSYPESEIHFLSTDDG